MKVLVVAEQKDGKLKKSSTELLPVCEGQSVTAVLFGSDAKKAAEELSTLGVEEVLWVNDPHYNDYHSLAFGEAMQKIVDQVKPELILGTASSVGKDLLPIVAAKLDAPIAADCTELSIKDGLKLRRPFFSGKALADVQLPEAAIRVVSMRPNSLTPGKLGDSNAKVTEFAASYDFDQSPIEFVGRTEGKSDRPDLTEASVIISGGRSLKSRDNFKIIFDFADLVGGAVGASRAAVDEGMADHDMQVGQTGKTVNPNLYIACGISGAIQHLAGMRTSKIIVAINKDQNAPIFGKANYGIVGDLFEIVPLMTEAYRKLKAA